MKKALFNILIFFTLIFTPMAASHDKTKWFTDSRFGMFIHFGLYSIPSGEWEGEIMGRNMYAEWIQKQGNWPSGISNEKYQALTKEFNPVKFNADEWVLEAKNAGMKYILITAKHHDGFALWPSKVSKYNVRDATPLKRDILGELISLVRKNDPDCLINSRILTNDKEALEKVDFESMMDNHFPKRLIKQPWETSATMNDSWAYHKYDYAWHGKSKYGLAFLDGHVANLFVGPRASTTTTYNFSRD
ncbi:alpha-L-fucosidase [Lentisphaera profundi]|uniref:alpha-L-fucosidase n=1 Tax=Lentisphaera profundi TaxID=1658616 RepID=A0ABY7VT78_9BACT|nr:alpha-L-fucosidase [Lentisphaera profundi]WDE96473.1 alpha-L-fucosidase [Lentisphaera profundi]